MSFLSLGFNVAILQKAAAGDAGAALTATSAIPAMPAAPSCEIELDRISYDDPGVDDEEWIQLRIHGDFDPDGCADLELQLLNGGAMTCPPYRRIPVPSAAFDADGYLVVCSASLTRHQCDISNDDKGPLPAGWLQNGPDAVRLAHRSGAALWTAGYGQTVSACETTTTLPNDKGEPLVSRNDTADDVIARCEDGYRRLSMDDASPRVSANCDQPSISAPSDGGLRTTEQQGNEPGYEEQLATQDAGGHDQPFNGRLVDASVQVVSEPLFLDGGTVSDGLASAATEPAAPSKPPKLPSVGCAVASFGTHPCALTLLALAAAAAALSHCRRQATTWAGVRSSATGAGASKAP